MICGDGEPLPARTMIEHFMKYHKADLERSLSTMATWPDGGEIVIEEADDLGDFGW